ncbi:MAG TPA: hypothetical protein VNN76_11955 [Bacteroidota bacterium]|nr:hypothetical protein [Bacteroidota bacterium]
MGRTVPTFTNIIDNEVASWAKYRRGLQKEEQEIFDEIFRAAKRHLATNFYAMRTIPFESIIMSIIIEQGKLIRQLRQQLEQMEKQEQRNGESRRNTVQVFS